MMAKASSPLTLDTALLARAVPRSGLTDIFTRASFTSPGVLRTWNEDRSVSTEAVSAVIDGTTALTSHKIEGMTPAEYCARFLARSLEALSGAWGVTRNAKAYLQQANRDFGEHLRAEHPQIPWGAPKGPSAAVVVVVKTNPLWGYAYVGDCTLMEKRAGEWRRLTRDQFAEDEASSIALITTLVAETGARPLELLKDPRFLDYAFQERATYNQNGKGVANGDPAMDSCIEEGEIDPTGLEALLLVTDGMEWPEGAGEEKYLYAARRIEAVGPEMYHAELMALFDSDPQGEKPLRLKHSDDATSLLQTFTV